MLPEWIDNLEEEDLAFMKKFVLTSGSLKEMAKLYNISYPTVRLRLDRLIQKINLYEEKQEEPYVHLIKEMVLMDKLDFETAKLLIDAYKKVREENQWTVYKFRKVLKN